MDLPRGWTSNCMTSPALCSCCPHDTSAHGAGKSNIRNVPYCLAEYNGGPASTLGVEILTVRSAGFAVVKGVEHETAQPLIGGIAMISGRPEEIDGNGVEFDGRGCPSEIERLYAAV